MDRNGWIVVIRYFCRTDAEDKGVNVGIIAVDQESDHAVVLFRNDWAAVLAYDPVADVELIAEIQGELQSQAKRVGGRSLISALSGTMGNSLRCLDPQPIRLEKPLSVEAARLASEYLT